MSIVNIKVVCRYILMTICLCLAGKVNSQNQVKADSIRDTLLSRNLSITERMEAYYDLCVYSSSPVDELKYGKLLLNVAEESGNHEYILKGNQRIGTAHRLLGNLGLALEYLFKSADLAAKNSDFSTLLADTYQEIAACYTLNNDSENALLYGAKTINILRKIGNKQSLSLTLLNIGYDHYLIENYDSALVYYNESEDILREIGLDIGLAYIKGNRALVYWKNGDVEKAKKDLYTAVDMLKVFEDHYAMSDYYNQLGTIFLEEKDYARASSNVSKGLAMALQAGLKEQVRDASRLLFKIYESQGNYVKAIAYQTQYHNYKDSIQNLETTQKLGDLRLGFEVGRKQSEVDLLLQQKRTSRIIMITGGIILVIVIALALIIYSYSKSKTRLNLQLEEQKDSLITLNSNKDKFFSIISHDLRGPVSTLSGLVSVTKYFVDEKNASQLKEVLGKMEHSVDGLIKLLDNLLHWALQQRGHFPYVPEKLHLKSTLEDVVGMFGDMAKSKNIQLDLTCAEDINLLVDKNATSTIFRNLLNNAIKFTPTGGKIKVAAEFIAGSGVATIKFIDNGVGISEEKLGSLFKLNENANTRGTSGESGLGLGLQLVQEFTQLNKGKVSVESEEGKGTTFKVDLPLFMD